MIVPSRILTLVSQPIPTLVSTHSGAMIRSAVPSGVTIPPCALVSIFTSSVIPNLTLPRAALIQVALQTLNVPYGDLVSSLLLPTTLVDGGTHSKSSSRVPTAMKRPTIPNLSLPRDAPSRKSAPTVLSMSHAAVLVRNFSQDHSTCELTPLTHGPLTIFFHYRSRLLVKSLITAAGFANNSLSQKPLRCLCPSPKFLQQQA